MKTPIKLPLVWFGWLAALFVSVSNLSAQNAATGVVSGQVTNLVTGDILKGAIITVPGTTVVARSGQDGHYAVAIPVGSRMLQAEYTGLDKVSVPVTVVAGETTVQNLQLTSDVYHLEKYTVHSIREGEEQALQDQRNLPNVTETMATDAYGIPPPNPGMLFARMPEVYGAYTGNTVRTIYIRGLPSTFELLLVDGNQVASSAGTSTVRQIQIDQFGTAQAQEVQLVLEPTPDMPGDAIGGILNLVTKRIYDVPDGIQLTVGTSWLNNQDSQLPSEQKPGTPDIDLVIDKTYSVGGGKSNLGIEFVYDHNHQAGTEQQEMGTALISASPAIFPGQNGNTTQGVIQYAIGNRYLYYGTSRDDTGGFDLDYKPNDNLVLSLKTTYNHQYYHQEFYGFQDSVTAAYASFVAGSTTNYEVTNPIGTASVISSNFVEKSVNYTLNPDVVYSVFQGTGKVELQGMYSYANIWYPDYEDVTAADSGTAWSINRVGYNAYNPQELQVGGPSWYNPANYIPTAAMHYTYGAPNSVLSSRLDYTQNFSVPVPSYIKVGVGWQGMHSWSYSGEALFNSFGGPTSQGITPWLGQDFAPTGLFGPFPFMNIPDSVAGSPRDVAATGYFQETSANAFSNVTSTLAADANFQEDVSDAYIMGSVTLGKLTILGGMREEYTSVEGQQFLKIPGAAVAAETPAQNAQLAYAQFANGISTNSATYRFPMPGIFFIYEPIDGLLAKASYNVTVTRPPIANILPGYAINPANLTISAQNPHIKPYTSQNFEFNVSKYFEPVGLFEVGVFLKQITNYIYSTSYAIGSGANPALEAQFEPQYVGYTLTTSQNIGNARFRGFYSAYQQQFTGLPGWLGGFGVTGNVGWLQTEGDLNGATTKVQNIANFIPFTANYGITYVWGGLQLHAMANYACDYLTGGTYPNTNGATLQLHRTILNFSGDYAFNQRWDMFLLCNNPTNEYTRVTSYGGLPMFTAKQGVAFSVGVHYMLR